MTLKEVIFPVIVKLRSSICRKCITNFCNYIDGIERNDYQLSMCDICKETLFELSRNRDGTCSNISLNWFTLIRRCNFGL